MTLLQIAPLVLTSTSFNWSITDQPTVWCHIMSYWQRT